MMALAGVELETLVSEPDALTTRPSFLISLFRKTKERAIKINRFCGKSFLYCSTTRGKTIRCYWLNQMYRVDFRLNQNQQTSTSTKPQPKLKIS